MDLEIKRTEEGYLLETEQWIPRPVPEVFAFFSEAANLETLTPSFLGFKMLTMSTLRIEEGTLIRYRLKVHGVPIGWTTRIEEWVPNAWFVDHQLKGPYALWHHTHSFQPKEGGTLMQDRVRFQLPLGLLGDFFGAWLVKRDVREIFEFRRKTIAEIFPRVANLGDTAISD